MQYDQAEHRLSHYIDALLDRILLEPCWYSAIDHFAVPMGETDESKKIANMVRFQRLKAMGVKPAHLDWFVYQKSTGIYAQIELKVGYKSPSVGQETTMKKLRERGIPTGCAKTIRQFYNLIVDAGFLLHANAENIVTEIEARHAASDDKAEMIKSGEIKKKKYKPKKAGPRYQWKAAIA